MTAEFPLKILIADDEPNIRLTLATCLQSQGHHTVCVGNAPDLLFEISGSSFDLAMLDLRLGEQSSLDLIPVIRAQCPWTRIVVITAFASVETAVEAMKRGASDYLPKPFIPAQVEGMARKIAELRALEARVASLQEAQGESNLESDLSECASPAMQRVLTVARQAAPSEATLLIQGESGTGKGVLARAIHQWSNRRNKPFSIVSCPSLSGELLESELFGHARGAFTGAVRDNPGRISLCEGGTILLDEIGDLPLTLQPKLLRFIQDREYERVGQPVTRKADVRILVATNRNLQEMAVDGRFREDLFYRLNVIRIDIPPLRERPEDVRGLAERMLAFFAAQNHRHLEFEDGAAASLSQYPWPGNVRELRNAIERAAILCSAGKVGTRDVLPSVSVQQPAAGPGDPVSLDQIEEQHIRKVLARTRSMEEAARLLDIDEATLRRRRRRYGL